MENKKCFRCNKIKPLEAFNVNGMKYQLKSDKGCCITCKKCMIKHSSLDMKAMVYNFDTGKFEIKHFKTKKEIKEHYESKAAKNGIKGVFDSVKRHNNSCIN